MVSELAFPQPAPLEQPELFEPEHDSYQQTRLKFGLPERIYAERWKLLNARPLSGAATYLEMILCPSGRIPDLHGVPPISRRDAAVAASVIQWLGTNCGMGFLRETERIIEKALEDEATLKHAEHELAMVEWNREVESRRVFPLKIYKREDLKTRRIVV